MKEKILFKRKVAGGPGSFMVSIPVDLGATLNIKQGDYLYCYLGKDKEGLTCVYRKIEQQKEPEEELDIEEEVYEQ